MASYSILIHVVARFHTLKITQVDYSYASVNMLEVLDNVSINAYAARMELFQRDMFYVATTSAG